MKFVAQWKCNRWVNFHEDDGSTAYFATADDAKAFVLGIRHCRPVEVRITEYLGGRKYREIEKFIAE